MYDEVAGVDRCVSEISAALAALPGWFLVVVDDGSTDGTGSLLDELSMVKPIEVVHHQRNQGYGRALRTGAVRAKELGAEWLLFMDSDLTNPPEDLPRFARAMDGVDVVKASRYARGGCVEGVPLKRRVISRVGNAVASRMFGVPLSDVTNGFRAIKVDAFLGFQLVEEGFAMIAEEMYWIARARLKCREVPTVLRSRSAEMRTSSFRYKPSVFYHYGRYPLQAFADRLVSGSNLRGRSGRRS